MEVLAKSVMAKVVGGAAGGYTFVRAHDGDSGGGGDFGGGSVDDIGWTGTYEGLGASGTGYDIIATGGGHAGGGVTVFDNTAPVVASTDLGFGEHTWVEPGAISDEHKAFDMALSGMAGRFSGVAATVFVDSVLEGAGVGSAGGPWGTAAGLAVGTAVGIGSVMLLNRDHDRGHFVSPGEPGAKIP